MLSDVLAVFWINTILNVLSYFNTLDKAIIEEESIPDGWLIISPVPPAIHTFKLFAN